MIQPEAEELHDLLNCFRSVLDGTCSPRTRVAPTSLSGYFIDPATGLRRPLGQTRRMLLDQVSRAKILSDVEHAVVSFSYGLELTRLPATTSDESPSIATLLPAVTVTTGRKRSRDAHLLGASGVRQCRRKALEKLAGAWAPSPGPGPFRPAVEPPPTGSDWFSRLTGRFDQDDLRGLLLNALRSARRTCGPVPGTRDELWQDLDWWEFRHNRSRLSGSLGRPEQPINQVRHARAEARMSIAIWDLLEALPGNAARPPAGGTPPPIIIPSALVSDMIGMDSETETVMSAIRTLEGQGRRGATDPDLALLLAWLEPSVSPRLDQHWCGRAAAVVTRAAGDYPALHSLASGWYHTAVARGAPRPLLAEATLNLSVVYSARRKYAESAHVLNGFATATDTDPVPSGLIAIGQAAWRRRALSEVLRSRSAFNLERARRMAVDGIRHSEHAIEQVRRAGTDGISTHLRATIRLAEALALFSALLHATTSRPGRAAADINHRAAQLYLDTDDAVTRYRTSHELVAYEKARLQVIAEIAHGLERGEQILDFRVLTRATKL
ncbi:hypothetical protein FHR83_008710 [Actinoplanes campanulatus]|uniref:Uncharacterized protein n=1 Tax=Actinoplanes campanulatus TaxID=113559 RepID=A0A7W5AR94_9ACTN|nr:hypothetical protein [Actinoplanes campanulatus]MBB3100983.1 hypothetical protein [Actinoplanes campanulatus]GID41801.1 hypothetical protein Aca09nite_83070 [Actinoplanes campanulatus]